MRGIGSWSDYIAKTDRTPRLVSPEHPEGKHAALQWQVLASSRESTLLQIDLETGRPHQIRLQGTSRGHPILGDVRYGAEENLDEGAIALHHAVLRVDHPAHRRRETFVASPPDVWRNHTTDEMWTALQRMLDRAQMG